MAHSVAAGLAVVMSWLGSPFAAETADASSRMSEFANMSIEDLMRVRLSLSRTDEKLVDSAAAAYIITDEDIRRSGVTTIADALRMAPGLEVAKVDAHTWAVTARGFNDTFANKLLVMIDGRTVYTPLFSGVFWDVQDTMMEDIDHIEIIRGPGSTLWGANAVNGVINIVTKNAAQTVGGLATAGAGTEERGFGAIRYGGSITEEVHYRTYVKYFQRDGQVLPGGADARDDWRMLRGGFRLDWTPGHNSRAEPEGAPSLMTLEGDIYGGHVDQTFDIVVPGTPVRSRFAHDSQQVDGGNLLGRWKHNFSDEQSLQIQTYFDRTHRDVIIIQEQRDTFDLDAQHRFKIGERNDIIWGGGYRMTRDEVRNTPTVALLPDSRTLNLFSMFAQDEISIVDRTLRFIVGSKLEHNDFTGWEIQPGGRVLWTPATNQSVWASVTRAVRTPSRAEDDVRVNTVFAPGAVAAFLGNPHIGSEDLIAYELGYRVQPATQVSFDIATFYNDYDKLRTSEFRSPPPGTVFAQVIGNEMHGETYGAELATTWQPVEWWRLRGSYTYLQVQLELDKSNNPRNQGTEHSSPQNQFMLRSTLDLPKQWEFDCAFRYVDSLSTLGVPSYFSLDARLAWRPIPQLEAAIVGQNLLDHQHAEFAPTTIRTLPTEVQRGVYGKLTWRF